MRGWSAIVVGFLLLGLAVWSFAWDGFNSSTLMCATAAAFIFFRGAQGMEIDEVGDPSAVIEFVRDPADAIVDTATERLGDWFTADEPDFAKGGGREVRPRCGRRALRGTARHRARRMPPAIPAPVRGFGRKGL